jgi:uncharacterized protein (TIRG00374 family)
MASERRPGHPAARVFNLIALAVGVIALAIVVGKLGWSGMRQAIIGTGVWFALIAAIDLVGSACDGLGVYAFVRPHAPVSYRHVFAAQLSGIAINRLTPGNTLGEPVKVTMLVREEVPADVAVSAIMLFQLVTLYIGIAVIAIGVPLSALLLDLPADIARAVWIALAILVGVAVALAILVRRGALGVLVAGLARVRVISTPRAERWQAAVASIDERVKRIGQLRAPGLGLALAGVIGSRVANLVGTVVVLHAVDIPLTAPLIVASLSVGILVTWLSNVIPLGLGIADGTNYVLYGIFGASSIAGLLFTMVNRLRTVVLALMGLIVMAIANAFHRRAR